MAPPKDKKRLVPYLFAWTQNLVGILLILRMTTVNECLGRIASERVNQEEMDFTARMLLDWVRDVRQIDGIAEWAWRLLDPHDGLVMLPYHRPAPSKATLRFLPHLAYISSGTACGIAALLAEESRRQIALVKKIAENGRIVKNCTRRNHAAAALRALEEDQEFAIVNGLVNGAH
ncbi:hypothetical protein LTR28_004302 [Elasticomyces elasticus]|nr:hypothetical protein LTR28_004302 [Elasticomyces elasticus]